MKDALLEIGTEHLPARFIGPAMKQLEEATASLLKEKRLGFTAITAYGSPKRLAVRLQGVEEKSPDMQKEVSGPPAALWKDQSGKFTPQSAGFARSQGVKPESLEIVKTPKGEFLFARKLIKGETAEKILAVVFPAAIQSLQFPKNMIWEESQTKFARPIRSLVSLYGDKIVKFSYAGVASGRKTSGLGAGGQNNISIEYAGSYFETLSEYGVMPDAATRRDEILAGITAEASKIGGKACMESGLVEETVFLTEKPVPITGSFEKRFQELPSELITTVLKKQLKLFPVHNSAGEIQPYFIAVRDGSDDNHDEVRSGYESVVEARMTDAMFFYTHDLHITPAQMRDKLKEVMYHEQLGTLYQKSCRVEKLTAWLVSHIGPAKVDGKAAAEIASLSYADLTSNVVREFPELQGYMGGQYAAHAGMSGVVASGVSEFYFPLTAKSDLPTTLEGAAASLAGKIDTLAGDFSVGMIPSGSEDPHGLRRIGTGVVRIVLENNLDISLREMILKSIELIAEDLTGAASYTKEECIKMLEDFIWQRLEAILQEKGLKFDEIRAVKAIGLSSGNALVSPKPVTEILKRAQALHNIRKEPDFESIAVSFKRVSNIIRQSGKDMPSRVDEALFEKDSERNLSRKIQEVKRAIEPHIWNTDRQPTQADFEAALREMVTLKPVIDSFFEEVMVMDENMAVRRNRIALLTELHTLIGVVADLSFLQQ